MSEVWPLGWVPPSACERVAQTMNGLLASWASTWGLPAMVRASARPLDRKSGDSLDFIDLAAPPPAVWRQALSEVLFGCDATGSAVFDAVLKRVGDDLRQTIERAFGLAATGTFRAGDEAPMTAPGHRGVVVQADIAGHRCGVILGHSQWRNSNGMPKPTAAPMVRVNLEKALASTPVSLVAELGRADVTIKELLALAPGDVLLLTETLDAPLRIVAPGSALVLAAHLGACLGSAPVRAARWLAQPPSHPPTAHHEHPRS